MREETPRVWIAVVVSSVALLLAACSSNGPKASPSAPTGSSSGSVSAQPTSTASQSPSGTPLPAGLAGRYRITYKGKAEFLEVEENGGLCLTFEGAPNCYLRGEKLLEGFLTVGGVEVSDGQVLFEREQSDVLVPCKVVGRYSFEADADSLTLTVIDDACVARRDLFVSGPWQRQS